MTPKTLFNIILKILGIFFIRDIFNIISQLTTEISFMRPYLQDQAPWLIPSSLLMICIYAIAIYLSMFKTDYLIDKLKLEKGIPQDPLQLKGDLTPILRAALILTGSLLVLSQLPFLVNQLFSLHKYKNTSPGWRMDKSNYAISSAGFIIIGLVIVTYQKRIANLILKQSKT
jgi:hypothetical protein